MEDRRGWGIPWSWAYGSLWATWYGDSELNLSPNIEFLISLLFVDCLFACCLVCFGLMNNKQAIGCSQTQTSNLLPTDVCSDLCQENQASATVEHTHFLFISFVALVSFFDTGLLWCGPGWPWTRIHWRWSWTPGPSGPPAFFTLSVWITGVHLSTRLCQATDQTQSFLCARQVLFQASHFPGAGFPWFSGEPLVSWDRRVGIILGCLGKSKEVSQL